MIPDKETVPKTQIQFDLPKDGEVTDKKTKVTPEELIQRLNQVDIRSEARHNLAMKMMTEGAKSIDEEFNAREAKIKQDVFKLREEYLQPTRTTPQQILGDIIKLVGAGLVFKSPGLGIGLAGLGKTIKESDSEFQRGEARKKFGANLLDQDSNLALGLMGEAGQNKRSGQKNMLDMLQAANMADSSERIGIVNALTQLSEFQGKRESDDLKDLLNVQNRKSLSIQNIKAAMKEDSMDSDELDLAIRNEYQQMISEFGNNGTAVLGTFDQFRAEVLNAMSIGDVSSSRGSPFPPPPSLLPGISRSYLGRGKSKPEFNPNSKAIQEFFGPETGAKSTEELKKLFE